MYVIKSKAVCDNLSQNDEDAISAIFLSSFLVADTQLYKRLCPSVGWLVRHARVENAKNAHL